jgi:ABC-type branched-subunit amino acid transport system permease subunit
VGAFALTMLHEFFSSVTTRWQLWLGASIVLIVLFMPGGLGQLVRRARRNLFGGPRDV